MAEGPSSGEPSKIAKILEDPEEKETQVENDAVVTLVTSQVNEQKNKTGNIASDELFPRLGRDLSITILTYLTRSKYGMISSLNRSFRHLVRSGELYKVRRQMGIVEHWVYFSCNIQEWAAFDPSCNRWMNLPNMITREMFSCSDKESLAVGTDLLVFGSEIMIPVVHQYNFLTNTWSDGVQMNNPRCLFASANVGAIAILAGGVDHRGNILSVAEMYNSETRQWENLPKMNKARKNCSGFFMDGKFYALGGIAEDKVTMLTCAEEYDLTARRWRVIEGMVPPPSGPSPQMPAAGAPPLVAVVNNVLYAADYSVNQVQRFEKENNSWVTIGYLPQGISSMNGWGVAFRGCGERIIVIGGPNVAAGGVVEINSWIPDGGAPQWEVLARRPGGNFVFNCTVMGC